MDTPTDGSAQGFAGGGAALVVAPWRRTYVQSSWGHAALGCWGLAVGLWGPGTASFSEITRLLIFLVGVLVYFALVRKRGQDYAYEVLRDGHGRVIEAPSRMWARRSADWTWWLFITGCVGGFWYPTAACVLAGASIAFALNEARIARAVAQIEAVLGAQLYYELPSRFASDAGKGTRLFRLADPT